MTDQSTREYTEVTTTCKELFAQKTAGYGAWWRILLPSITGPIFIKAPRIHSIQEKKIQKATDSMAGEFIGLINYCLFAIIQTKLGDAQAGQKERTFAKLESLYEEAVAFNRLHLQNKNHNCDSAWRNRHVSSMIDTILMALLRVKQIEDNRSLTPVSEGVAATYQNLIHYSVFCLIQLKENQNNL